MADQNEHVAAAMSCLSRIEGEIIALCRELLAAGEEELATTWFTSVRKIAGHKATTLRDQFNRALGAHRDEQRSCWYRVWSMLGDWERQLRTLQISYDAAHGTAQIERVKSAPRIHPMSAWGVVCGMGGELLRAFRETIRTMCTTLVANYQSNTSGNTSVAEPIDLLAEIRPKDHPRCLHCGYDISVQHSDTKMEPRCPECGHLFERYPVVLSSYFDKARQAVCAGQEATARLMHG